MWVVGEQVEVYVGWMSVFTRQCRREKVAWVVGFARPSAANLTENFWVFKISGGSKRGPGAPVLPASNTSWPAPLRQATRWFCLGDNDKPLVTAKEILRDGHHPPSPSKPPSVCTVTARWLQSRALSSCQGTRLTPQIFQHTPRSPSNWGPVCATSHQAPSCPPSQGSSSQTSGRTQYGSSITVAG